MTASRVSATIAAVLFMFAAAVGKADVIDVCGAEKEDSVRLACFDRAVAARRAGVADAPVHSTRPGGGESPAHAVPVVARIVAMHRVSANEFAFELDNGQVWQQIEAVTALDVRLQESVRIAPGVLGAFLLTTAQKQTFRVKRTR